MLVPMESLGSRLEEVKHGDSPKVQTQCMWLSVVHKRYKYLEQVLVIVGYPLLGSRQGGLELIAEQVGCRLWPGSRCASHTALLAQQHSIEAATASAACQRPE